MRSDKCTVSFAFSLPLFYTLLLIPFVLCLTDTARHLHTVQGSAGPAPGSLLSPSSASCSPPPASVFPLNLFPTLSRLLLGCSFFLEVPPPGPSPHLDTPPPLSRRRPPTTGSHGPLHFYGTFPLSGSESNYLDEHVSDELCSCKRHVEALNPGAYLETGSLLVLSN